MDFESAEDLKKALELTGLKEVFEDTMEIRLVSKDGKSKDIAYIEFKTEVDGRENIGRQARSREMGNPFPCTMSEKKVEVKSIAVERIELDVVNHIKQPLLQCNRRNSSVSI